MQDSLKALLEPKSRHIELAPGVAVIIKELSLRERISWRSSSLNNEGGLNEDWVAQLLFRSVRDVNGEPLWNTAEDVDGSESVLATILEHCQSVNGLTVNAGKEAEGNSNGSPS